MTISSRALGHIVDIQDGIGRDKFIYTQGGKILDVYLTKEAFYTRERGGDWLKVNLSRVTDAVRPASHPPASIARLGSRTLPDRTVNGVLMGSVSLPPAPRVSQQRALREDHDVPVRENERTVPFVQRRQ